MKIEATTIRISDEGNFFRFTLNNNEKGFSLAETTVPLKQEDFDKWLEKINAAREHFLPIAKETK